MRTYVVTRLNLRKKVLWLVRRYTIPKLLFPLSLLFPTLQTPTPTPSPRVLCLYRLIYTNFFLWFCIIHFVSYILYHTFCVIHSVSYILYAFCIIYSVSFILYHTFYIIYFVSYILYNTFCMHFVSYILYLTFCVIHFVSYILYHTFLLCIFRATILYSQRMKINLLHNAASCLQLDLQNVLGAPCGAVVWGTAPQAARSRVRFPVVSLEFFIDIILPAALWPWCRLNL